MLYTFKGSEKMKILDVGSYKGRYKGSNKDVVITLDIDKNNNPDVVHDLEKVPYPFEDNEFDMVYASHVLEHLSNPLDFFKEMQRICKRNAIIKIRVPHFSSVWAYNFIHKRYFGIGNFYTPLLDGFEIKKIRLNWLMPPTTYYSPKHNILLRTINNILNFLANLNQHFCERFWCYFVGGFSEIEIQLLNKKKVRR